MKSIIWFPYRVYAMIIFIILLLIAFLLIVIGQFLAEPKRGHFVFYVNKYWGKLFFIFVFIRLKVEGLEYLQKNDSVIFIGNHRSYIDAAIVFVGIPKFFKPLGKEELGKLPIFGSIYKSVAITVDRSSAYKRARSVKLLKRQLHRGISILLFPEGTFNMSNDVLIPFHDGAFRIAIESQTIIQPFIINGTQKILHRHSTLGLYPGRLHIKLLPPFDVTGYKKTDCEKLKMMAFNQMSDALIKDANWN